MITIPLCSAPKHTKSTIPLQIAIKRLASIHDGISGQSIPNEVMALYKAVKNGDRFRPKMLKVVVLTLRSNILAGITDQSRLLDTVHAELVRAADRLPKQRLEEWLSANPSRANHMPVGGTADIAALRSGYVSEAMVIAKYAFDYATALADRMLR
jgi:hypothetical protein